MTKEVYHYESKSVTNLIQHFNDFSKLGNKKPGFQKVLQGYKDLFLVKLCFRTI